MDRKVHTNFEKESITSFNTNAITEHDIGYRRLNNELESHLQSQTESTIHHQKVITVDQAFEMSGGFGKFQIFSTFIGIMSIVSGIFFLSCFVFLELIPKYECYVPNVDIWVECST
jgi:hypothetical protein